MKPKYKAKIDGKLLTTMEICEIHCWNTEECEKIGKTNRMRELCEESEKFRDPAVENLLR
jgi:hypothetical protein